MPVKRSLKLDDPLEANSFGPSKITRKKSITDYSPTTGTCHLSPFASPTRSKEQEHKNGPSNGKRKKLNHLSLTKRKKSTTKEDELMTLLSKVEKSSEEVVEIMQGLSSIQALEGNRKLENLIGISCGSCFLKREMQKTKELMTKVTKQKLFEKKSSELSNKVFRRTGPCEPRNASRECRNERGRPLLTPHSLHRGRFVSSLSYLGKLHHLDSYEFLKAILN